jgi:hypothetical protein
LLDVAPAPSAGFFDRPEREFGDHAWSGGSSAMRAAARRQEAAPPRPPSDMPKAEDGFSIGARVSHPMFGSGKVLGREGSGKGLKLTIQFTGYGTKRILPAYTQLTTEGTRV